MINQHANNRAALWLDFSKSQKSYPLMSFSRASTAELHLGDKARTVDINVPRIIHSGKDDLGGLRIDASATNLYPNSSRYVPNDWNQSSDRSSFELSEIELGGGRYAVLCKETNAGVVRSYFARRQFRRTIEKGTAFACQCVIYPKQRRFLNVLVVLVDDTPVRNERVSSIKLDSYTGEWQVANNGISNSNWMVKRRTDGGIWVGFGGMVLIEDCKEVSYMDVRATNFNSLSELSGVGKSYESEELECFAVTDLQLELNKGPTSFIQTGEMQVTRASEAAVIDSDVFQRFYNPEEGTILCNATGTGTVHWQLGTGTTTRIFLEYQNGKSGRVIVNNGVTLFGASSPNIHGRTAFSYNRGHYVFVDADGTVFEAANAGIHAFAGTLHLGHSGTGAFNLNGCIHSIGYYDKALSIEAMKAWVNK